MSKHTPGPWFMSPTHMGKAWDIGAEDGSNIALVHSEAEQGSWESVNNAILICAAPDLLEALRDLYDAVRSFDSNDFYFDLRAASSAIAKAEGRS